MCFEPGFDKIAREAMEDFWGCRSWRDQSHETTAQALMLIIFLHEEAIGKLYGDLVTTLLSAGIDFVAPTSKEITTPQLALVRGLLDMTLRAKSLEDTVNRLREDLRRQKSGGLTADYLKGEEIVHEW